MRFVLALLLVTAVVASAQQNATPAAPATPAPAADTTQAPAAAAAAPASVYHLQVGPVLHIWGAAVNTVHAEGRKVNWGNQFVPYAGASILAPFGTKTKLGLKLDLAWSEQTMITRPFERYPLTSSNVDWKGEITERYSHFCVAPSLYFSGFTIGVGFNMPMSVKFMDDAGNEITPSQITGAWIPPSQNSWPSGYDFSQDMQMSMDIRIGGVIPVWETDMGALNVEVLGKYNFTGLWADGKYPYGTEVNAYGVPVTSNKEVQNVMPASFSVGISYLFDLKL